MSILSRIQSALGIGQQRRPDVAAAPPPEPMPRESAPDPMPAEPPSEPMPSEPAPMRSEPASEQTPDEPGGVDGQTG